MRNYYHIDTSWLTPRNIVLGVTAASSTIIGAAIASTRPFHQLHSQLQQANEELLKFAQRLRSDMPDPLRSNCATLMGDAYRARRSSEWLHTLSHIGGPVFIAAGMGGIVFLSEGHQGNKIVDMKKLPQAGLMFAVALVPFIATFMSADASLRSERLYDQAERKGCLSDFTFGEQPAVASAESKRIAIENAGVVDLPQSLNPTVAAVGAEGVRGKPFSISIPVGPLPSQALVFTGAAALLMAGAVMVVLSPVGI